MRISSHNRGLDVAHPDILLDRDRASCRAREQGHQDGESVFALAGRGAPRGLVINSPTGNFGDTELAVVKAARVGAIKSKRKSCSCRLVSACSTTKRFARRSEDTQNGAASARGGGREAKELVNGSVVGASVKEGFMATAAQLQQERNFKEN